VCSSDLEQIGTPQEIYNNPASLFVAGFIGSANLLPGQVVSSDGGDTVVELSAGHTVRARTDTPRPSGTPVSVMLRPERLIVAAEGNDGGRSIEGTVADIVFQGATARIVVHLRDESEVIASVITGTDLPFLHPGSPVHLSWEPDSAFLLSGWPRRAGATDNDLDLLEEFADS